MNIRIMQRNEINRLSHIDRSEIIEQIYYYKNNGLTLVDEHHVVSRWDSNNLEEHVNSLYDLYDRSGSIFGAFIKQKLIGIVALDSKFIGKEKDTLILDFLHVDRRHRRISIGRNLLEIAAKRAKHLGAKKLYISATPSKNTVEFYLKFGCKLTEELNKELYELEPDDIHLELDLNFIKND